MNKKELTALFALDCNIKIYIPSTTNATEKVDTTEHTDRILSEFSKMFGGATSYAALGAWRSQEHGLIKEHVTIVEAFCDSGTLKTNIDAVVTLAEQLKEALAQEAVALEVNGKLGFI